MYQSDAQVIFAKKLTNTVKSGGLGLNSLLAIVSRSLLMDGFGSDEKGLFGVYPSSNSGNNDGEILTDFTHRLRTTVSRVRFAERTKPLFIRHQPALQRSTTPGIDRTDPSSEIQTICLNPYYKGRLNRRHVIVIDDCTTYGVSFGVAAAFLRKAGAPKVTGIAMGKFGNQLRKYDITINSDPFAPVKQGAFSLQDVAGFSGATSSVAQHALQALMA
jgi:hypothetical protein